VELWAHGRRGHQRFTNSPTEKYATSFLVGLYRASNNEWDDKSEKSFATK